MSETPPSAETNGNGKNGKKNLSIVILAVAIIASCVYGAKWFVHRLAYTVTEDAQIDADLLPVSSKASGRVIRYYVSEGDEVKAGQLLAEIDPTDYELALERARAGLEIATRELEKAQSGLTLTNASSDFGVRQSQTSLDQVSDSVSISSTQREVNLNKLKKDNERAQLSLQRARDRYDEVRALGDQTLKDLERAESLYKSGVVSKAQLDQARTNADAAANRLAQAGQDKEDAGKQLDIARGNLRSALVDTRKLNIAGMDKTKAALSLGLSKTQRSENAKTARASVGSLRAKVRDMRAAVKQAEVLLRETRVLSPVKGVVAKKTTAKTEFAPAGKPLCFIIDTSNVWVSANIEETFLKKIVLGANASIAVDAIPGKTFHGKVSMIGSAANSRFSLIPQSNPSGQFIKVTQRLPIKVIISGDTSSLKPGMNVEVEITNKK